MNKIAQKYNIKQTKNIQETLTLYPELDYVIAGRLHASILSTVHAIPHIILSYSRKTDEFAK
jgi:polysaccharide pyruvyl transferase WcaK-like protein